MSGSGQVLRWVTASTLIAAILALGPVGPALAEDRVPAPAGDHPAFAELVVTEAPSGAEEPAVEAASDEQDGGTSDAPAVPRGPLVRSGAGGGQAGPLSFQLPTQPQATVDPSTGALVYDYAIELPAGRQGLTPEVSLRYNSRSVGNLGSFVGLGWELALPSIQREPVRGTQALYETSFFSASLSGNLIADEGAPSGAAFRPETDDGSYRRYVLQSDGSWKVTAKDGRTWIYGETLESRQDNPADSPQVFRWMLSRVTDSHGNEIQCSYAKDQGQIYPSQISYAHHPVAPAVHTVTFGYTSPSGGVTHYNAGFPVVTARLLSTITVTTTVGDDIATDTYTLAYDDAQFLDQKRLRSITRTTSFPHAEFPQAFDDTTSFAYSEKAPGWEEGTHSLAGYLGYQDDEIFSDIYTGDFERNGYSDVFVSYRYETTITNYLLLNDGTHFMDVTAAWGLPTNVDLSYKYAIADVNGDRLPDLHPRHFDPPAPPVYLNTGTGFVADLSGAWLMDNYVPEVQVCGPNTGSGGDAHSYATNAFLYDIDRDGKNDIVYFGGPSNFKVFLNTGEGWAVSSAYTFTAAPGTTHDFSRNCQYEHHERNFQALLDVNGDGLEDYVHQEFGTYLNTGAGFAYYASYNLDQQEDMDRSGLADLNGDGLIDFISFKAYDGFQRCARVLLNTGVAFTLVNPSTFPPCEDTGLWTPHQLRYTANSPATFGTLLDVTADGLPDVVGPFDRSTLGKVRATSDGRHAWSEVSFVQDPWVPIVTPSHGVFFDINTDGVLDFVAPELFWDGEPGFPTKVYMGKAAVPNRLVEITSTLGAKTKIEYATAPTDWSDTAIAPMPVVSKLETTEVGWSQPGMVTRYDYSGGAYAADQATGQRRFAGFHVVTAMESGGDLVPLRTTSTYFHQANGSDAASAEPEDANLALIGKPYYSVVEDPSGTPKREMWTRYGAHALASEDDLGRVSTFAFPTEVITKTSEGAIETATAVSYAYDLAVGERSEEHHLGFVTVESDGSYEDLPGDSRHRFTLYATNAEGTIVRPSREDIRAAPEEPATVARAEYRYDEEPFGTVGTRGNVTLESKWVSGNGTEVANIAYAYDDFGNVLTKTNPRGAVTTYTYDPTQSLVATETNALGHPTAYEYLVGRLRRVTDPNGNLTTYDYSTRGWLYRVSTPKNDGIQTTEQFLDGSFQPGDWRIETDTRLINSQKDQSWQLVDNLGRPIHLVRKKLNHATGAQGGYFLKESRGYDALGREITRSAPLETPSFDGPAYVASMPIPPALITTTTYDVFDRPLSIANALGTTAFTYAGPWTRITDPNGKLKEARTDAYGNLVEVREHKGPDTYSTSYAYDARDLLTQVTDALGNVRAFAYDNAGWLTLSEDLHASGDADFGATSFTYDLGGNQITETKPDGTVVTREYDLLDRLTAIIDSTQPHPTDFTLTYDTCTGGVGRLCGVEGRYPNSSSVSLEKSFIYGPSAPRSVTLGVLTSTFTTHYEYTLADEVRTVRHPDGTVVEHTFGDWALPDKVYTALLGGAPTLFATASYHHTGQPEGVGFSNGVAFAFAYDDAKRYRKSTFAATFGETILQSYVYAYDNTNNVTQVVEPGVTKKYVYDDLNRLTSAVYLLSPSSEPPGSPGCDPTPIFGDGFESGDTSCWGGGSSVALLQEIYAYDAIGNITAANGVPYSYNGAGKTNPHAVTGIGPDSYAYDDNGNMVTGPGLQLIYNWQNQPTSIDSGDGESAFAAYDETGKRFWYQTPDTTEVRVSEEYLFRDGDAEITVLLGKTAVGVLTAGAVYTTITDHLGTPVKQLDSAGAVGELASYGPFGAILASGGTLNSKRGYTGHEEDADTGLIYAKARYYSPVARRFVQLDPSYLYLGHQNIADLIGTDRKHILSDPQQLNSYSYVGNNPTCRADPTGMLWWEGYYNWEGYSGPRGDVMKLGEVVRRPFVIMSMNLHSQEIESASAEFGVNSDLVRAIYYEEGAHLLPGERLLERFSSVPNSYGELQVTTDKASIECLRSASCNIRTGVKYMASIREQLIDQGLEPTPAAIASAYNGLKRRPLGTITDYGLRIANSIDSKQFQGNLSKMIGDLQEQMDELTRAVREWHNSER